MTTDVVIVSTARTGLAKSWKGAFNMTYGATLAAQGVLLIVVFNVTAAEVGVVAPQRLREIVRQMQGTRYKWIPALHHGSFVVFA